MKICPQCKCEHNKRRDHCSRSCGGKTAAQKIVANPEAQRKNSESNKHRWTDIRRADKSLKMRQVVSQHVESYSKENVSGRVKMYEVLCGNTLTKVKGTWELKVAHWLNANNLHWTNKIEPIPYMMDGILRSYFPDFYVNGTFIEVKGFETEKDKCKWKAVKSPLIIIRKQDLLNLDNKLAVLKIYAG